MGSNALTPVLIAAFGLCLSAVLAVSLLLWLRGRLSDRGKAVARNGLVVAVLLLVIALACFSVAGYGHTPCCGFPGGCSGPDP